MEWYEIPQINGILYWLYSIGIMYYMPIFSGIWHWSFWNNINGQIPAMVKILVVMYFISTIIGIYSYYILQQWKDNRKEERSISNGLIM